MFVTRKQQQKSLTENMLTLVICLPDFILFKNKLCAKDISDEEEAEQKNMASWK